LRLIDEFLAKSGQGRCRELKETADVIAKVTSHSNLHIYIYIFFALLLASRNTDFTS